MNSWAPLFCGLVDSSIWEEPDHVFRVFMAMMSLKDSNHIVSMDGFRLAKRIHMPIEKVLDALKVLAEPDQKRPGQEFDGRRIEAIEEGWLILKGEYYRQLVSTEMRRARNRRSQQAYRDRQRNGVAEVPRGTPLAGEQGAVRAMERGDERTAERIAEEVNDARGSTDLSAVPEEGLPIPEIGRSGVLPGVVNVEAPAESGQFVDGVWVPD